MNSLPYRFGGAAIVLGFAALFFSSNGAIPALVGKRVPDLLGYGPAKPSPAEKTRPDTTLGKTLPAPCAGVYPTSGAPSKPVPETALLSNSPSTGCAESHMTGGATESVSSEGKLDPAKIKRDTNAASAVSLPSGSRMAAADPRMAEVTRSPAPVSTANSTISFVVAATPSGPAPKPAPAPATLDRANVELPSAPATPLRTAPIGETEPVPQADGTRSEVLRKSVLTPEATPTPEPTQSRTPQLATKEPTESASSPSRETAAMQPGVSVSGGIEAPELHLALQSWQVRELLAAGGAVAFAVSERTGKEIAYFDRARRQFRPISEWSGHISDRVIAVKDQGLVASWSFYSSAFDVTEAPAFVIRFTPDFEKQILSAQFAALDKNKIDFSEVVQKHRHVITNGRFTDDLQFVVESVNAN